MITPEVAAQEGITGTTGALVREVAADGPAAQAGLKQGDVIVAVNGQPVDDQNDLRTRVAAFKPNDEITLTVVKGTANGPTDQHEVKVKLGERAAEQSFNFQMPFDGNGLPQLPFGNKDSLPAGRNARCEWPTWAWNMNRSRRMLPRAKHHRHAGRLIKTVVADSPRRSRAESGRGDQRGRRQAIDETNNLRTIVANHKPGDEIR
jgi:membrane-associated protease RseP (regulator of RpoE activity)